MKNTITTLKKYPMNSTCTLVALVVLLFSSIELLAQNKVGNNPSVVNSNAVFEAEHPNKGLLVPRVALTSTNSASPLSAFTAGMVVYNTATSGSGLTQVAPGFYYSDSSKWVPANAALTNVSLVNSTSPAGGTVGQMIYNTNSSSGIRVGPVYWNGTTWVELAPDTRLKFFYSPSISIPITAIGTGFTVNLYNAYATQFATPAVASAGAPTSIPTYSATELNYYITSYDNSVLANVSISNVGLMTYDVISTSPSFCSFLNVVFTVK